MVKVLAFALSEGKVAIHSHAGLGRTGVLVACYLIYTFRCKPTDAVAYVRNKRPGSVQTKSQVESVQGFAQFVVPMFIVYANVIPRDNYRMSLNMYLKRQRFLLHGFEGRLLKHVPKPIFIFCERLLSLMNENFFNTPLIIEDLFNGPNQFLEFFSSRCRLLRISFSPQKKFPDGQKWALSLPKTAYMNGIVEEPRHCAPPSPPNGEQDHEDDRPFWDSPDSQLTPEDCVQQQQAFLNHVGGFRPPMGGDINYNLSDDEENGPEPEMEYTNKSISNAESSKDQPIKGETIGSSENLEQKDVEVNTEEDREELEDDFPDIERNDEEEDDPLDDLNSEECNEIIDSVLQESPSEQNTPLLNGLQKKRDIFAKKDNKDREELEDDFPDIERNEEEEDDPLDDLNSEECNEIIDSVLQESPSEQNTPLLNGLQKKRDIFAKKDNKGCSTLSIEEEACWKPLTNTNIIDALLADHYIMGDEFASQLRKYQRMMNNRSSVWDKIAMEVDPVILSALLWSWLDQLREPVLNRNDLSVIVIRADRPMEILMKLDNGTRYTTEYLVRFIARLQPKSTAIRTDLLRRLVASLTHQSLGIQGTLRPVGMEWNKLRQGTAGQLMLFIDKLYEMIIGESGQKCTF
nr:protein tyrosine phosphatase domain-containing protein 1-like [Parasteatoda tepidariorum]